MIYPVEEFGRECAWHIAEGARAKTLRQKDWIRTGLWKAFLHRRSNLHFKMRGIFQVKQQRHENKDTCSVIIFMSLFFYVYVAFSHDKTK